MFGPAIQLAWLASEFVQVDKEDSLDLGDEFGISLTTMVVSDKEFGGRAMI